MVGQVLEGPLAGYDGLHEEAEHGEHGKPPVLKFLHLELREGLWVVGQAKRVEATARVEGVGDLAERPAGDAVALDGAHEDDLGGPDGQDALRVHQAGVAQVVQPTLAEDLRAGLEPHGLAELDAVAGQQLREDAAEGAEHRPSRVDHLQLTILGEGLGVGGEPSSVPSVVAGELAGQVGGGLAGEGAQVLDAVRAVPWAAGGSRLGLACGFPHADPALALSRGRAELNGLTSQSRGRQSHRGSGHFWRLESLWEGQIV